MNSILLNADVDIPTITQSNAFQTLTELTGQAGPSRDYPIDTALLGEPPLPQQIPMDAAPSADPAPFPGRKKRARVTATTSASPDHDDSGSGGGGPSTSTSKGATRELKQSKRAEQNRVAQRAFRERKEQRIRDLEAKSDELETIRAQREELEQAKLRMQEREIALAKQEQTHGALSRLQQEQYEARINELMQENQRLKQFQSLSAAANDSGTLHELAQSMQSQLDAKHVQVEKLNDLLVEARRNLADRDARLESMRRAVEEISIQSREWRQRCEAAANASPL